MFSSGKEERFERKGRARGVRLCDIAATWRRVEEDVVMPGLKHRLISLRPTAFPSETTWHSLVSIYPRHPFVLPPLGDLGKLLVLRLDAG